MSSFALAATEQPPRTLRSTGRLAGFGRGLRNGLAVIGLVMVAGFVGGLAVDVASFDNTRGGYEAPYTGWTGTPIDWKTVDVTPTGFAKRGYVANTMVNCTTGMISFQIYQLEIPFRQVSERAILVHKPREACFEKGFRPEF